MTSNENEIMGISGVYASEGTALIYFLTIYCSVYCDSCQFEYLRVSTFMHMECYFLSKSRKTQCRSAGTFNELVFSSTKSNFMHGEFRTTRRHPSARILNLLNELRITSQNEDRLTGSFRKTLSKSLVGLDLSRRQGVMYDVSAKIRNHCVVDSNDYVQLLPGFLLGIQ